MTEIITLYSTLGTFSFGGTLISTSGDGSLPTFNLSSLLQIYILPTTRTQSLAPTSIVRQIYLDDLDSCSAYS
jgi:hypothetical protein